MPRFVSKFVLPAIAGLSCSVSALAQTVDQGPIVNTLNGHTYYRLSNTNWTDARNFAVNQLGGDLVTINDADENAFVLNNFANLIGRVWIGLNDGSSEGTFTWSSGQASVFTNWDPGEPNNGGGVEDYVLMYSGNGRWNDVSDVANVFGIGPVYGVVEIGGAVNNTCATAIDVSAGGTFAGSLAGSTFTSADGGSGCGLASNNGDVWYVFRAPGCVGRLTASTCGTNDTGGLDAGLDTVLSFRNSCGGAEIGCNDDAVADPCGNADNGLSRDSFLTRDLAPGEVVYIRVSPYNGTLTLPFILNISFTPTNDECTSPSAISAGTTTVCTGTATGSTPTTEIGCAPVARTMNRDVWFRYVPVTSGVYTVQTCAAGTTYDTILAAYASCPAAAGQALVCNDDACSGLASTIRVNGNAGVAQLIRLASFNANSGNAELSIYCPADYNLTGTVSVQDIFDFLAGYFANDFRADINGSGAVSVQDIFDFLNAYFGGC